MAHSFSMESVKSVVSALQPGELLNEEVTAPDETGDVEAARGRHRSFSETDQEVTWKRRIAPRHRGVVRRYFSSEEGR